jgi:hypothetical protein
MGTTETVICLTRVLKNVASNGRTRRERAKKRSLHVSK